MKRIVCITTYRGQLVAVDEAGDLWWGSDKDLGDPDFCWHLAIRGPGPSSQSLQDIINSDPS